MNLRWSIVIVFVALLSGCGKPSCLNSHSYKTAKVFPPLDAPPGMTVPQPDPNNAIPQVKDGPVGYVKDPDANNDQGVRCLDVPPRLPRSETK